MKCRCELGVIGVVYYLIASIFSVREERSVTERRLTVSKWEGEAWERVIKEDV